MSVARSVGATTLPLSVQDTSDGAGKGGFLVSGTPIVIARRLIVLRGLRHAGL